MSTFSTLKANSLIYILHKDVEPHIDTASVVSTTPPMPKYQVPTMFGQPQELTVDVTVKVGEQTTTFNKLPANADIADFNETAQLVISTSRDAMNAEVASLKQQRLDVIASIPLCRKQVECYEAIQRELNPEYAERQAQMGEVASLRESVANLTKLVSALSSKLDGPNVGSSTSKN